jgi:hypothetical protein
VTRLAVRCEFRADAQDQLNILHAVTGRGINADSFDVADLDAIEADRGTDGDALDFGQVGDQAILWPDRSGTGDIEDADRQNSESYQYENSDP